MNTKIATAFAFRNVKANKILYIPFILSGGIMIGLFNIMISLLDNDYVKTRHEMLPNVIVFGAVIVGLFSAVFVMYAGRFLSKRRSKEYALYTVLGLEKKHIRRIVLIEYLINMVTVSVLSIVLGYVFGKFLFIMLNRAMNDMNVALMNYPLSLNAVVITALYILGIFVLLFIDSVWNLRKVSAVELMSQSKSAEKEPKFKLIPLLFGFLSLGAGYALALYVSGSVESMLYFFVAAILVAIGTYLLFTSFSIAILKVMKRNKRYYYKDKNFLSVSGMMYRMKSNALGLASIAVLCTGVIITISATLTINDSMKTVVSKAMKNDYSLDYKKDFSVNSSHKDILEGEKNLKAFVENSIISNEKIEKFFVKEGFLIYVKKDGEVIRSSLDKKSGNDMFLQVSTLDAYNKDEGTSYTLKKNQVLITSNRKKMMKINSITLAGRKRSIIKVKDNTKGNIAADVYSVVVADYKELVAMAKFYKVKNVQSGKAESPKISLNAEWNVSNDSKDYFSKLKKESGKEGYALQTKREIEKFVYELNGGFLFLGLVIGFVFLIGTILITYYKQISEGYEDRENYQIMKKVGLPDELIKKTSASQIIWMFFIPLIVAMLHSTVASKIVYQLLGLFGLDSYSQYFGKMVMITGAFALIYLIIFKLTSNIYYRIVR